MTTLTIDGCQTSTKQSSVFKLQLYKIGTFEHSDFFQRTNAIYTSGEILLGLPSNLTKSFKILQGKYISTFTTTFMLKEYLQIEHNEA